MNLPTDQPRDAVIRCNHLLLKQRRSQCGLSINELAARAGCPADMVNQAESEEMVPREIFAKLAGILSAEDQPLTAEDLICRPAELAFEYFRAIHEQQKEAIPAIRHLLDENVVFKIAGDPKLIPFAGEHHGITAVDAAMRIFFSVIEVPAGHDFRPHYQFITSGLNAIVIGQSWMHPVGKPLQEPMPICHLFRFRRGKIYHLEDNFDFQRGAELLND